MTFLKNKKNKLLFRPYNMKQAFTSDSEITKDKKNSKTYMKIII